MDCQRSLFSLADDRHYLNAAYLTPLLNTVKDAGYAGVDAKNKPWNITPDHFFEDSNRLRSLFNRLVHGAGPKHVAIIPAVSYGMAAVAQQLPDKTDKEIIIAGHQFPSNVYPWRRYARRSGATIRTVSAPKTGQDRNRGNSWNEAIIDAISPQTLMVAISQVHWSDGTLFNLQAIGKRARAVNAYLVIDGTQSVGALPFDVQQLQPDALVCAGYKWLMGPYGIGLAYFSDRLLGGTPLEEGWLNRRNSKQFSTLTTYTDDYQPGALRYDVGQRSNFITVPMLAAGIQQLLTWTPAAIQTYCRQLTADLTQRLAHAGYAIAPPEQRAHHLFGLRLPQTVDINHLQQQLSAQHVHVSIRGDAIRISPHVYNRREDINALQNILMAQAG